MCRRQSYFLPRPLQSVTYTRMHICLHVRHSGSVKRTFCWSELTRLMQNRSRPNLWFTLCSWSWGRLPLSSSDINSPYCDTPEMELSVIYNKTHSHMLTNSSACHALWWFRFIWPCVDFRCCKECVHGWFDGTDLTLIGDDAFYCSKALSCF